MKTLFHLLYLFIVGCFIITGNSFFDKFLGTIIAVIAYIYAFKFTGGIAGVLGYNSILMSFSHYFIRTLVSILMIIITRPVYTIINNIIASVNENNNEYIAIGICAIFWLIIAETLKKKTNLRKNYW